MVCIQRHTDPAIVYIVFDTVLNQVADGKCKLHLIHICLYRTEAVQNQIDIALVRDRTQTLENILKKLIDIHMCDVHICCLLVHLNKGKQVCDDLILSVDLGSDVTHKFLIKFLRNSLLSYQ